MNTSQLEEALRSPHFHPLPILRGQVRAKDEPIDPTLNSTGFIFNTDTQDQPGTHWIAVYVDKQQQPFYFDSYGFSPDPAMRHFMQQYGGAPLVNRRRFQSNYTNVCGHYCLFFLHLCAKRQTDYFKTRILEDFFDPSIDLPPWTEDFLHNDTLVKTWVDNRWVPDDGCTRGQCCRSLLKFDTPRL